MKKLEPCPFCGNNPKISLYPECTIISCEKCKKKNKTVSVSGEGLESTYRKTLKRPSDFKREDVYNTQEGVDKTIDLWNERIIFNEYDKEIIEVLFPYEIIPNKEAFIEKVIGYKDKLDAELKKIEMAMEDLEESKDSEMNDLQEDYDTLERERDDLEEEKEKLEDDKTSLEESNEELNKEKEELEEKIKDLETDLEEKEKEVKVLERQVEELENE